jgi:serine/threonine protein phosphatase PrpC
VAGRASIVGAAATHVGKVREHNEDAHFFDVDHGVFLVCDGMGGHAAGEVASALAIKMIRNAWCARELHEKMAACLDSAAPAAKHDLLAALRDGVTEAHAAIVAEATADEHKKGMGTTLVGAIAVGNELVFAHAGDSRAYLVRDAIAMQLTEDHTLLARLLAAGIDVDVSGEGARFRSMLTNALGIGNECKVATFVVPLADGDRFLLCSDGVSEYVKEDEVGEVLTRQPSPARAANRLIELALERGGSDNATAIVLRVLEAGDAPQPAEQLRRDEETIAKCPLWGAKATPQQRLRARRIAIPRDHAIGERIPAQTLGDRVAWILVEGKLVQDGSMLEPGELVYPEALIADSPLPDRDGLAVARTDVRMLALRSDDFRELCEDDSELGELLHEVLGPLVASRRAQATEAARERARTEIDFVSLGTSPIGGGELSAVEARVDAQFSAVTASASPTPEPSGERVPLILTPRSDLKRPSSPPQPTRPAPNTRAPRLITEPEIETEIELEADEPPAGSEDDQAIAVEAGIDRDPPGEEPEIEVTTGTVRARSEPRAKRISEGWED